MWEAAPKAEAQERLMQQAAQHLEAYLARRPRWAPAFDGWEENELERPAWVDRSVLAHAYALTGDLDDAHRLAAREKALGWSDSNNVQGFVVSLCFVVLSGKAQNALPSNLKQFWRGGLGISFGRDYWDEDDSEFARARKRLEGIYADQIPRLALSQE
jgi:hypothetical protein